MKSRRSKILQRLAELVAEAEGLSGEAWRSRVNPIKLADEGPVAIVTWGTDTPTEETLSFLDWFLPIQVSIYARGAPPDEQADALITAAYDAIMGDMRLREMCIDFGPTGIDFRMHEGDGAIGITTLGFSCKYRTHRTTMVDWITRT